MEFLIELLIELIFEGGIELSANKKISKWIRYPLIIIIMLFFGFIIFGLLFLGISLANENIYLGLLLIVISLILLVAAIYKFKKIYIEKER